jgi:hypothetical protein
MNNLALPDVDENILLNTDSELLPLLLMDQTTGKNILWMTNNYKKHGAGYEERSEITIPLITGKKSLIIKPRVAKSKHEQYHRVRDKGEVFTPSWVCNTQNNLIDQAWFGRPDVFNFEEDQGWVTNVDAISFDSSGEKTWRNYVRAPRLEISCGEAPYLVSRYDTTTGDTIPVERRIGLLDRKLRVVTENTKQADAWISWSKKAVMSVYGYEWQGDNLLLARENVLLTYVDYYRNRFNGDNPSLELMREIAQIISWNLWQMDGLKFVVPSSCHETLSVDRDLFEERIIRTPCEGCSTDDVYKHNGAYCMIRDWQKDEIISAVSLLGADNDR